MIMDGCERLYNDDRNIYTSARSKGRQDFVFSLACWQCVPTAGAGRPVVRVLLRRRSQPERPVGRRTTGGVGDPAGQVSTLRLTGRDRLIGQMRRRRATVGGDRRGRGTTPRGERGRAAGAEATVPDERRRVPEPGCRAACRPIGP